MASSLSSSPTPGSRAVLRGAGPCATQQEHSSGAGPPEFDSHPDVFHLSAWGKLTNFPRALLRNRIRTPLPCKLVITPSCRRKLHAGELHYRLDSAREPGFEFWVPPARGHWGTIQCPPPRSGIPFLQMRGTTEALTALWRLRRDHIGGMTVGGLLLPPPHHPELGLELLLMLHHCLSSFAHVN